MSEETFQARALYEFIGQDDTELNFQPNDILTITSTNAGDGWWYANNASGQSGAVPAAYLEKLSPTSDETPSATVPTTTLDEMYEAPAETQGEVTSTLPFDPYMVVQDVPVPDPLPPNNNDLTTFKNDPIVPAEPPFQSVNPFGNVSSEFQLNTNSMTTNLVHDSYASSTYYSEPPALSSINESTSWMSMNITQSPSDTTTNKTFSNPPPELRTFELPPLTSSSEPAPTPAPVLSPSSPQPPLKEKKSSVFGTISRKKKDNDENRRKTAEVSAETASVAQNQSDSDSFSDSGTHTANSPTSKPAENKAAKARFFDKHGLDSYILSGSKLKLEDHAEIAYDERQGGVYWVASRAIPPFTCRVEQPHKGKKLGGLKAFMEYGIHTTFAGERVVNRRYKHFDWLYEQLLSKYRFICVPQLPGKQIAGRFEQEFVQERRRQLELWLNRICHHPVLCASFPVQHFVKCDANSQSTKEWKSGKRKVEKEESRDALWLHCVNLIQNHPHELEIATSIETFAQQQPALETHLKNLTQGLSKFVERHTEIYEKDMQRIGELFSKVHTAVEVDVTTPGNQEIANSIAKIGASYNAIAQLYKTKACDGIRFFNEHLQEHIGILSSFPSILHIYRSATEFIRSVQQAGPAATPDYNGAIQRNNILNHVILAEINLFQRDKVHDLHLYMKTVITEQIQFYEKVTDELREALSTFH